MLAKKGPPIVRRESLRFGEWRDPPPRDFKELRKGAELAQVTTGPVSRAGGEAHCEIGEVIEAASPL